MLAKNLNMTKVLTTSTTTTMMKNKKKKKKITKTLQKITPKKNSKETKVNNRKAKQIKKSHPADALKKKLRNL